MSVKGVFVKFKDYEKKKKKKYSLFLIYADFEGISAPENYEDMLITLLSLLKHT